MFTSHYDPLTFYEDPYPIYRALRASAPVYYNETRQLWVLSRHAAVEAAARDRHTFSSAAGTDADDSTLGPGDILDLDPPRHDELRAILRYTFARNNIKALESVVTKKVNDLLDPLIGSGQCDFARDFAHRLPFAMICHLWGVPASDQQLFEGWFARMIVRESGELGLPDDMWVAADEMSAYLSSAVADRQRHPRDDLLSVIAEAVSDGRMNHAEIDGMCRLLLLAGIHTTETLIANSLYLLAPLEGARHALANDPSRIPVAIEELLRYESPIQWLARVTTKEVEIEGQPIPNGERVVLLWGSANRDERRFTNPDRLDLDRAPNGHVAFGQGIHFCLGTHLARLEARVAFEVIFRRIPEYEVIGPVEWMFTRQERGISSLPVRFAGR